MCDVRVYVYDLWSVLLFGMHVLHMRVQCSRVCSFICLIQCQPNDRLNRSSIGRYRSLVVWIFLVFLLLLYAVCAQLDDSACRFSPVCIRTLVSCLSEPSSPLEKARLCCSSQIIWRPITFLNLQIRWNPNQWTFQFIYIQTKSMIRLNIER